MADQKDEKTASPTKSDAPPVVSAPTKNMEPRKLDETIPGGRYLSAPGQYVDANGVPLKDQGK